MRGILRGDVSFFTDRIVRTLDRGAQAAERHAVPLGTMQRARDVGVIAGTVAMLMSLKFLKVLPGLPIAPGHKNVLFIPLYILAAELTHTRWGATITGTTMGIVAFLMGDGKYGPFEIFQHVAAGLGIDIVWPLARRLRPSVVVYGIVGVLSAAFRFATVVGVMLCLEARDGVYALAAPFALPHLVFGALSGIVTRVLLQSVEVLRAGVDRGRSTDVPPIPAPAAPVTVPPSGGPLAP